MTRRGPHRNAFASALLAGGLALAACGEAGRPSTAAAPDVAAARVEDPADPRVRIRFYEAKLAEHPDLFAGHAELGAAYLDLARETHDVDTLRRAREALERSLEIQPNLNALATLASLCNFSHRFACAIQHAQRAAQADPTDARVQPLLVEAYLGLGQLAEASRLVEQPPRSDAGFAAAATRGRWLAEQERYDEAHASFVRAAELALQAEARDLAVWAWVNAAGMRIDSERPALARPHLEAAATLLPVGRPLEALLRVHWAELHALEQRPDEALREYEAVLAHQDDPELLRRAFLLARQLGREQRARELFQAAERSAERIADAGEIFALEAQATLYADAGVELERAEQLALRNLEHKRDLAARRALEHVRSQRAAAAPETGR